MAIWSKLSVSAGAVPIPGRYARSPQLEAASPDVADTPMRVDVAPLRDIPGWEFRVLRHGHLVEWVRAEFALDVEQRVELATWLAEKHGERRPTAVPLSEETRSRLKLGSTVAASDGTAGAAVVTWALGALSVTAMSALWWVLYGG